MAEESNEYIYAGFWRRYAAVFLDGIISFGIFWLALLAADAIGIFDISLFFGNYISQAQSGYIDYSQNPLLYSIWFIFLFFYLVVTISLYGATPGKRFFGIAVISKSDHLRIGIFRSLFRFILYFISGVLLLLPFLTQLFTKKRQTLYDLMVKTIVIKGKFVNGELTETEDEFTKKWLVFLLPVGLLLVSTLFIVGIPAYYGYMEAEQNQVDAMQDNIQKQPSKIVEQQSSQPQPIGANEAKLIDDNYVFIGSDENSTTHYIKTYSVKDLNNDKREAIFKLNMPSIDASSKIKQVIDCKNFQIQTIEGEIFEQQHLKGTSTFIPNASEKNVKAILSNSLDMKKYAAVCGGQILSEMVVPGFNLPDTTLTVVESLNRRTGNSFYYRNGDKFRAWFKLSVPYGPKNIDEFKTYSLLNEVNCKTSSFKTLLITEFDGTGNGNTDKYKTSYITTGQIKRTMTAMNKRIPKTTELAKKAIISYFCDASN
tara:strand:- start:13884 stop:15335 length:1452 start_codon:yes stop_codon:yes gene_type:complete